MSARHKARKRALDILFSADLSGADISSSLEIASSRAKFELYRASSWAYAKEIVEGIISSKSQIDRMIEANSEAWPLSRMPTVDRALLRIATWEIHFNPEIPASVAISEAINSVLPIRKVKFEIPPIFITIIFFAVFEKIAL